MDSEGSGSVSISGAGKLLDEAAQRSNEGPLLDTVRGIPTHCRLVASLRAADRF
jgi:hypothetical protein